MTKGHSNLTQAEWRVMECLWEHSPRTGREITQCLTETEGWNRSTTLTLLSRLEAKGAIASDNESGKKTFRAVLHREDAVLHETKDFLKRIYQGSVSLMVSAMTQKKALSKNEIQELYTMLKELEGAGEDV